MKYEQNFNPIQLYLTLMYLFHVVYVSERSIGELPFNRCSDEIQYVQRLFTPCTSCKCCLLLMANIRVRQQLTQTLQRSWEERLGKSRSIQQLPPRPKTVFPLTEYAVHKNVECWCPTTFGAFAYALK